MTIPAPAPVNALDVDTDGTFTLTHTKQSICADAQYEMNVSTFTHITPGMEPEYNVYIDQVNAREIDLDLASGIELLTALTAALETLMTLQPDHEATIKYRQAHTNPAATEKLEPWSNAKPQSLNTFVDKANRTTPAADAAACTSWMSKMNPDLSSEQLAIFHRWAKQALKTAS